MPELHIGPYERDIMEQLGCSPEDAVLVEDIMRNHVFHSTLDWQSEEQFKKGAREAWQLLESDRELFEDYYRKARAVFAEMRAASQDARGDR